jgi:hypothetical protein
MKSSLRAAGAALGLALLAACGGSDPSAPPAAGPPYIAALVRLDALEGVDAGGPYRLRVTELSGTLGVDTTVQLARVTDTLILSVPNITATYVVTLDGLPAKCSSKYGLAETIIVPANTNTTISRFFVTCRPLLRVAVSMEGPQRDEEFFYRVEGDGGVRVGSLRPRAADGSVAVDTLLLEGLPSGAYRMEFAGLNENCTPISAGLRAPRLEVPAEGGSTLPLRIVCSDPARRPIALATGATAGSGAVGFVLRARDGQFDIDWYSFDVTDCRGYSVRDEPPLVRRGLLNLRGTGDSIRLAVAVPVQRGDAAAFVGRCAAVRLWDVEGNSTPVTEIPIRANAPAAVDVEAYNAVIVNRSELRLSLGVLGASLAGVFPTVEVRDGILFGGIDGAPDIGIYGAGGFGTVDQIPTLRLGTRIQDFDLLASVVYVFDTDANFTRLRDDDLTR